MFTWYKLSVNGFFEQSYGSSVTDNRAHHHRRLDLRADLELCRDFGHKKARSLNNFGLSSFFGCPDYQLVPMAGLEPARPKSPPPQDGVSTNFTTSAYLLYSTVSAGAGDASSVAGFMLALSSIGTCGVSSSIDGTLMPSTNGTSALMFSISEVSIKSTVSLW